MQQADPFARAGPMTDHEILRQLYYGFQDFRDESRRKWAQQDAETARLQEQIKLTNGRVKSHDLWIAAVKGGLAVAGLGVPVITGVLIWAITT